MRAAADALVAQGYLLQADVDIVVESALLRYDVAIAAGQTRDAAD